MAIYIYTKQNDDIKALKNILHYLDGVQDFVIITESVRSFNEYNLLKKRLNQGDVLIATSIFTLAPTQSLINNELNFFVKNNILLLIYDFPTTYKSGLSLEINRAVLQTIHTFTSNEKISLLALDKNYSVGRNKLVFPQNWATLYEQWKNKEITSKEFIGNSGLKKATFYNMLSEYETLLQEQIEYEKLA